MEKRPILVPTDFSEVSRVAFNHAIQIAKTAVTKIIAVHIVADIKDVQEGRAKLEKLKNEIRQQYDFDIEPKVRVGDIFEDITEMAAEYDVALVVMGTHGLRGIQWLTGGQALKIITSGKTPFLVVQRKEIGISGYDDIVVPLDLNKETKQKLALVADAAGYFESRVHIITPHEDDEFLKNQLTRNMNYAASFFREKGIEFTTKTVESSSSNFDEAIVKYANEIAADLITIMNIPGMSILNMVGGNFVQNLITNEHKIPVLVINPKKTTHASIFGAYLGR